jgi:hypothetical protein
MKNLFIFASALLLSLVANTSAAGTLLEASLRAALTVT